MKLKLKLHNLFLLTLLFCSPVFAQDLLTIDEAIKIALEKNYFVLIQKNNQEIAKAQNNIGNAGMSPTVTANAALNLASLNSHQEFNTGVIQDRAGAKSNNLGASINADWTIFDGFKMFAVKKRLSLNEQLSSIVLKQQMENTVHDIILAYYDIVRIKELIKAAEQNLTIYQERRKIAEMKFEIGSDSKVDLLLSKSDENKARSSIIQLQIDLMNSKTNLNTLLTRPVGVEFNTNDSIIVNYNPTLEDLKKTSADGNSSLKVSRQNELIFKQSVAEAQGAMFPLVQLHGAYNFTRSQSQAGIVFLNRQAGLQGGVTASWLLFNGGRNNRLIKERNLLALNQKYLTDETQLEVDGIVYTNYKAYIMNKQIVDLEKQNLIDSKDVQTISLERYKIGKSNLLETIETQKNLEDAQVRYINALYNIKASETELLRANGNLVK